MITSPEERALYNEWVKLWESYKKGTEEVMALSRKAAGQIPREAHELNTKTVNKIGLEADAVLKKDIDLNNAGADKAAQDAADNYASAFMMLAAILGAAVIAGIAVSYLSGSRRIERHCLHRHADAGAGQRRSERGGAASGREDRNRRHGGHPAGVQAGADRQEGRRRGRCGRRRSQDRARPPRRRHHPQFRNR